MMKHYDIPFKGFKEGLHEFEHVVDDKFFEHFEGEIRRGKVNVKVLLQKNSTNMEFHFIIKGMVEVTCDRCIDKFMFPIESTHHLYVKFGEEEYEEDDDIVVLPHEAYKINVARYIFEFIHLSLPLQRFHPDDENGQSTCDQEMIKKIEEHQHRESNENDDPRWDKLKDILKNNN
jgi:uncharacterized metal-binding protein YceD (DUF177 family)